MSENNVKVYAEFADGSTWKMVPSEFYYDYQHKMWNIKADVLSAHRPHQDKCLLSQKKVIYNPPATIVYWSDGTKTVVKCDDEDTYSKQVGLALCYMKKILGNTSRALNDALKEKEE